MLPTRSQLRTWNPDSLSSASQAIHAAAKSVYDAMHGLDDEVSRMPEAQTWDGQAHSAAKWMFVRGTAKASELKSCGDAEGKEASNGAAAIGPAAKQLSSAADAIDAGKLYVSDEWVVLIKPAQMTEDDLKNLKEQAAAAQEEINRLLVKLDSADEDTAAAMQKALGDISTFVPVAPHSPKALLVPGSLPPRDAVPNPRYPMGLEQQLIIRDHDMATTVRESTPWHPDPLRDDRPTMTLTMMDGTQHELQKWSNYDPSFTDTYKAKDGTLISDTKTTYEYDRSISTDILYGDGTRVWMRQYADGKPPEGGVTTFNGRHNVLPEEFFTHPALTTAGGGFTALEKQSERGIPGISPHAVENIGKVSKFSGPAVGIATALVDTATAGSLQKACAEAFSGAAGVAGGEATGALAAAAFPSIAPLAAAGGNIGGAWAFGYAGKIVGNIVCGP
jgi:hypothetical protein